MKIPVLSGGLVLLFLVFGLACASAPDTASVHDSGLSAQSETLRVQDDVTDETRGDDQSALEPVEEPVSVSDSIRQPFRSHLVMLSFPEPELPISLRPELSNPAMSAGTVPFRGLALPEPLADFAGETAPAVQPVKLPAVTVPVPPPESPGVKTPGAGTQKSTAPAAAVTPSPAVVSPSSASTAPAGDTASGISSITAVRTPTVTEDSLVAKIGHGIDFLLTGTGWVYLGVKNEDGSSVKSGSLQYSGTQIRSGSTLFQFLAKAEGAYVLTFNRQDLSKGEIATQRVHLSVLTEDGFSAATAPEKEDPAGTVVDTSEADRKYLAGEHDQALTDYLLLYTEGDPRLNDRIAELLFEKKRYSEAADFWVKNIESVEPWKRNATIGLFRTAAALDNVSDADAAWKRLTAAYPTIPYGVSLYAGDFFSRKRNYSNALDAYEKALSQVPSESRDEVLSPFAGFLEKTSPVQDIRRSVNLYTEIVDHFPFSVHWDDARMRSDYLKRNFIQIR